MMAVDAAAFVLGACGFVVLACLLWLEVFGRR